MEKKRLAIYLDTSVFGGCFDKEFDTVTQKLFDNIIGGKYQILFSSVIEDELLNAPERVKNLLSKIPEEYKKRIDLTDEAYALADHYILEKVVGETSREDCLHIALATIHKVDILVSWNFKHIVNLFRIRGYNGVNLKLGYTQIEIRSPNDIINYEN